MSTSGGKHWYVVQTQPNGEAKAALNLWRQGFEVYWPRYLKQRRHARKVDVAPKPLFPRYMFVAIDVGTQRWRPVQSTFGVARLVCNGDEPARVPNGIVDAIRAREDAKGFVTLDSKPAFAPGDKVRVVTGAFAESQGLFAGLADHDRVSILLEMLGRKVRVLLDVEMVAAA